jgi:hypothetical protein
MTGTLAAPGVAFLAGALRFKIIVPISVVESGTATQAATSRQAKFVTKNRL